MNEILLKQTQVLLEESDLLASLCNVVAFLYEETKDINWLGLYFYKNDELVLGPFQGKVACTHIELGKGVCGTSFKEKKLLNVPDVHKFPGHIACDSASNSELVIPLFYENKGFGVLDIDSTSFAKFNAEDEENFKAIADLIAKKIFSAQIG